MDDFSENKLCFLFHVVVRCLLMITDRRSSFIQRLIYSHITVPPGYNTAASMEMNHEVMWMCCFLDI